jgi:ribosomal protein S18 acetylase RimI-like enzyme
MVAELGRQTFWYAFKDHPGNAPHDMAAYMDKAFSVEQIASELTDPGVIYFVAEIDGRPAGFAKLVRGSSEDGITAERPLELARLYSHQEFLGKGVGPALLEKSFEFGRENGHDVIWLGVWEFNPRAQAFYRKHGFREVGKHIFLLGSDPQNDLLMQKTLVFS